MPLSTLAAQVTPAGISAPSYSEILQSLQQSFQAIYGSDAYIASDSQDGQFLALMASAINDVNQAMILVYQSFAPSFAQGTGLSSLVKINGITRKVATYSTAPGNVVGQAGTVINNGVVADTNGNLWNLPTTVTIPVGGSIAVTVTAQNPGAIVALSGTINKINTPVLGWQSFTSTADATVGAPVETDAQLRIRQALAAALPSITPLGGLISALQALPGVTDLRVYENATGSVDANGIPARSISVIIEGGTLSQIAQTIGQKKTPGVATYGTTTQTYTDPVTGIVYSINFYVLAYQTVPVQVTVKALNGWSTAVEAKIQKAISDYINSIAIGTNVQLSRVYVPAYLANDPDGSTFEITALTLNGLSSDFTIPFNKAAQTLTTDVTITVSP